MDEQTKINLAHDEDSVAIMGIMDELMKNLRARSERIRNASAATDAQLIATMIAVKRRNEVERYFRRSKAYRRVFTRYDKLDVMYPSFVMVAMICEILCR